MIVSSKCNINRLVVDPLQGSSPQTLAVFRGWDPGGGRERKGGEEGRRGKEERERKGVERKGGERKRGETKGGR